MKLSRLYFSMALCALSATAMAQGTAEDYNRAYQLRDKYSARRVYHNGVQPNWTKDGQRFWYSVQTPLGSEYLKVNVKDGQKCPLFDRERLQTSMGKATGKKLTSLRLNRLSATEGLDTLRFEYEGKGWQYVPASDNLQTYSLPRPWQPQRQEEDEEHYWSEEDDERKGEPVLSPDGKYKAFIYGYNVRIVSVKDGKTKDLSLDGTEGNYYSARIQWSPDSKKLAVCQIRTAPKHYIYYVESSPKDQFQPKLHKQEYAKPGDERPYSVPVIFDIEKGVQLKADNTLFPNEYGLSDLRWQPDNTEITFEYNQRGHKVYRLLAMSASTGKVRTVVEESFPKYVNWTRIYRYHFQDGKRLLWSSERDNYNHLYLYDKQTGKVVRQLTKGPWYVREVQRVDEAKGIVYFSANGREKGQDPYFIHYYKVGLDGEHLTELTPEKANHSAVYSPDFKYLVDVYSTVSQAPVAVLRSAETGKLVNTLEKADISEIVKNGWKAPEVFHAPGRDGKTEMWGLIYRPSNFNPQKKYPVIDYIYSGPGDQYVPKSFASYDWWATSLAEVGFIVVKVDGMTTSFRSKEFEEVCYKNLQDGGIPDHEAWIKAAAKKYPYMDINKVGIYGCSAGGQEAMSAVLLHPDFYKAAYAASGCHDNRMDKIWWNEQWLGYPVDSSYVAASNIANAHLLKRPLMLCWGELDDNVDPSTTPKVVDALIKAGKDFEMIMIPGAHHTMGEFWGEHKRYDFFVRHLLGVNPPEWSKVKSDVRW